MQWLEISVSTTHEAIEAVANILYEAGANGVVIEDPRAIMDKQAQQGDWDYVEIEPDHDPDAEVLVKAYLMTTSYLQDMVHQIKQAVPNLRNYGLEIGTGNVSTSQVEESDWATAWKTYYKPVRVGKRLVVKPTWEEITFDEQDVVIELDPGLAFGTGTHPTTRMCLTLLERQVKAGMAICDVGCGSGVLSIAAAKLGASSVLAIDIDELAVKVTKENIGYNDLPTDIKVVQGDLLSHVHEPVDIVVANIVADVIIRMAPHVPSLLKDRGLFIMSGIIDSRRQDVLDKLCSCGFKIVQVLTEGEWVAVLAVKE